MSGAGTDLSQHFYGGGNNVAEITAKYHFNAMPGYKFRLQPSDSAILSYTLSKTDRTFDGRTVPFKYDAPHDLELSAGYEVFRTEKTKNRLSVNMHCRTGFPYIVALVRYPGVKSDAVLPVEPDERIDVAYTWFRDEIDYVGDEPNARIRNFFRTDVNFTSEKKRKHGSLIWQFSILNVTARNNQVTVSIFTGRYLSLGYAERAKRELCC